MTSTNAVKSGLRLQKPTGGIILRQVHRSPTFAVRSAEHGALSFSGDLVQDLIRVFHRGKALAILAGSVLTLYKGLDGFFSARKTWFIALERSGDFAG